MGALDVLASLSALGVRLTRSGEAILATPSSALTDEARALIRAHKSAILAHLEQQASPSAGSDPQPAPQAELSGHWLIVQPSERIEKWFTPPISRAELARRYPGSLLVALPDTAAPPPADLDLGGGIP